MTEAKAAAALSHPNICTVYVIAEADDKTFIAMEFGNARVEASPVLRKVPQYRAVHWDVSQVLSDEPAPEPTPTEAQDRYSFLWRAVVPAPRV